MRRSRFAPRPPASARNRGRIVVPRPLVTDEEVPTVPEQVREFAVDRPASPCPSSGHRPASACSGRLTKMPAHPARSCRRLMPMPPLYRLLPPRAVIAECGSLRERRGGAVVHAAIDEETVGCALASSSSVDAVTGCVATFAGCRRGRLCGRRGGPGIGADLDRAKAAEAPRSPRAHPRRRHRARGGAKPNMRTSISRFRRPGRAGNTDLGNR